ncbi:MAG: hypothetical protein NTZ56_00870 [Acidobacteria bacterium]|nr:hypothetical protein [Acidobacteriota bacterium]
MDLIKSERVATLRLWFLDVAQAIVANPEQPPGKLTAIVKLGIRHAALLPLWHIDTSLPENI